MKAVSKFAALSALLVADVAGAHEGPGHDHVLTGDFAQLVGGWDVALVLLLVAVSVALVAGRDRFR